MEGVFLFPTSNLAITGIIVFFPCTCIEFVGKYFSVIVILSSLLDVELYREPVYQTSTSRCD